MIEKGGKGAYKSDECGMRAAHGKFGVSRKFQTQISVRRARAARAHVMRGARAERAQCIIQICTHP